MPSEFLKKIDLPVVSRERCKDRASIEFVSFITSDKFCAGNLTGEGVCSGDSGGGLVLANRIGSEVIYTLRGIVSVSASAGETIKLLQFFKHLIYYQKIFFFYFSWSL